MNKRTEIIDGATRLFEAEGFRGIGIDRLIAPSGISTRTLYKHFGSRNGLVLAVLAERHRTFMDQLQAQPGSVEALFDTLRAWVREHGTLGCMLLRARSEYAQASREVVSLVDAQKTEFRNEVAERVKLALGKNNERLFTQVWLLFEGATAGAGVAGASVIDDAKQAALSLIAFAGTDRP
ncbi:MULTISPECIES: TetR/AcrR family transcriptional regulator [Gammaproteobacteria]|jgi:AcrR family transcriptional regulator|uniref:Transcriptional regulator, TetR family n=1 Tax=Halopseudomonas bauzanensis TaxID=653930 RepID=A0A031M946_9GAMM|nr:MULTISPECIES: TetR/AcrR family transcriptional regulator [Gammaproteobacteria]EZQ15983.1 TetR family transcriptional regulator [Halopseudomonas bauzanensis]MBU2373213.1 TetR/AcrR family transcriptional regulator [Gammaproteobacteria bacterium]SES38457.1 transcriptional regulator, TetR family [Halopseudomonas bauzanensis]SFM41950.1 transcriptional regulator, TetR family [Halopseudomonas bauzanensis]|tara:strand:- start:3330 stop:3869 length:540 start_codon:yes stop_codon:yes gene_type:complete